MLTVTAWRTNIGRGVVTFEQERTAQRTLKRQQRHSRQNVPTVPNPLLTCQICGKVCKSRIGLTSHANAHNRRVQQRT